MPGEDGLALMRKVRTTEAGAPQVLKAVAVSGYGSDEDREQAARAGFDEHISKPVDSRTLLETLVRLTRRL